MSTLNYNPPPTLRRFMLSDARVRAVRGPVGAAKSTAMAMELLRRACNAPPQQDGIRRSKFVIVRNTLQQLKTTCLITIQQLLRPIVHYRVSDQTIQVRLPGVESDWLLLPLDTPENVDRLLSLELTGAWISEFREIDPQLVQDTYSRCGRYPSRSTLTPENQDYWYGLVMETNSFSEDSPWYQKLEEELPPTWEYFVQPGAFEPGAENRENLPSRYYEDLMESNSPEWVDQYVHNKITPSLSGQAVFRNSFISDFHIAKKELIPVPGYPLIIGMDTGRQPAAVVCQLDHRGRMLVIAEAYASNMGMSKFLDTHLTPLLHQERLAGMTGYLVLDPVCVRRGEVGEESVLDACRAAGYQAVPAQTNRLDPRLRAVDKFLGKQHEGGPAMLFDPEHCRTTIISMQSRYRYKIKKDKSLDDSPEKNHPWSDLCFVGSTEVLTPAGPVPISALRVGDAVTTPLGARTVVATGFREVNELVEVSLSNGSAVVCTPNHPFVMADGCVVEADALQYGFVLESVQWQKTTSNSLTDAGTAGTTATATTGISGGSMKAIGHSQCTVTFGRPPTAPFQTGSWCIISTTTPQTMTYPIWSACQWPTTAGSTWQRETWSSPKPLELLRRLGTSLKKAANGIRNWAESHGKTPRRSNSPAPTAANPIAHTRDLGSAGSAQQLVSQQHDEQAGSTTPHGPAQSAKRSSSATDMQRQRPVLRVVGVKHLVGQSEAVYNLTVDVEHRYYVVAGGRAALVLNCDSLQYACLGTESRLRGRALRINQQKEYGPTPSAAGWT